VTLFRRAVSEYRTNRVSYTTIAPKGQQHRNTSYSTAVSERAVNRVVPISAPLPKVRNARINELAQKFDHFPPAIHQSPQKKAQKKSCIPKSKG
jgi:hypothetical protein